MSWETIFQQSVSQSQEIGKIGKEVGRKCPQTSQITQIPIMSEPIDLIVTNQKAVKLEQLLNKVSTFFGWGKDEVDEFKQCDPKCVLICLQSLDEDISLLQEFKLTYKEVPKTFEAAVRGYCRIKKHSSSTVEEFLEPLQRMSVSQMLRELPVFMRC